jgi:hypothetical protein
MDYTCENWGLNGRNNFRRTFEVKGVECLEPAYAPMMQLGDF